MAGCLVRAFFLGIGDIEGQPGGRLVGRVGRARVPPDRKARDQDGGALMRDFVTRYDIPFIVHEGKKR